MGINTGYSLYRPVKYLYCPKCKNLRVKSWLDFRYRCEMCFGDAVAIDIPYNWAVVVMYSLYVASPACAIIYATGGDIMWLYMAAALFGLLVVVALIAFAKGERYARAKIKITNSDVQDFRKKGWL